MLELFRSGRRTFVWASESLLVLLALVVATRVRYSAPETARDAFVLAVRSIAATVPLQASLYYHGLYADEPVASVLRFVLRYVRALAVGALAVAVLHWAIPELAFGRGVMLIGVALASVALPLFRLVHDTVTRSETFARRALVLGDGPLAREIADLIEERSLGLQLVGVLRREPDAAGAGARVLGSWDDVLEVAERHRVSLVLVADGDRRGALPLEQLLRLKLAGVRIQEGIAFYEEVTGKLYVEAMKPSQFIFADGMHHRRAARRLKRLFDLVAASIGLVLAAPLMAIVAVLVKLDSPGPVIYRQVRAGELGREFEMLKFRSMRADAEKDGAKWAQENDDRITRVGRFLRKTRLDELPQLWNVLRGEMSMVGPRPERPVFAAEIEKQVPFFRQRLAVRPGVTGHAQVRCRYAASVEDSVEKLRYDLYYVKSFSMLFDLSVLLDTVKVVLLKIGAR